MGRLENFDMRVEFHPDMLPAAIWWSVWDGVDGDVTRERARHASTASIPVHRYLRFLERTVVGFHWSWQAGGPGRPAPKSR